jgi:hypothetical protein
MATPITPVSSVATRSVNFALSDNDEIVQTWKQVEDRVLEMAGGDRAKVKQGLSIDSVLGYLDNMQADDKKAAEKHGNIKKIFSQTLQCIQTVGGIVADAASNVRPVCNLIIEPLLTICTGVPTGKRLLQRTDIRDSGLERVRGNLRESGWAAGEMYRVPR